MKNLLKSLFLFIALFAFTQGVWAETFITDVMVIAGDQSQTAARSFHENNLRSEAVRWFKKSAVQGSVEAMCMLGDGESLFDNLVSGIMVFGSKLV